MLQSLEVNESRKAMIRSMCAQYALQNAVTDTMSECGYQVWAEDQAAYLQGVREAEDLAGIKIRPARRLND